MFDQELNINDQGYDFTCGTDIIRTLSENYPEKFGESWFCGILSHTLDQGDEVEKWRELAEEHTINLKFFMPISKKNLIDPADLFDALYRTLINTFCVEMKETAANAYQSSWDTAFERIANIDPIEFEHAIVFSSSKEGASEFDTLSRIYSIIHKDAVKKKFLADASTKEFIKLAARVRKGADVSRAATEDRKPGLSKLRKEEVFESPEIINSFHEPLRNGDVFELKHQDDTKLFILLAQPCDLMVRSNGERVREQFFKVAVLAPIKTIGADEVVRAGLGFELPNFLESENDRLMVKFSDAVVANLTVLDLCVTNRSGTCKITPGSLGEDIIIPNGAWRKRVPKIDTSFKKHVAKIENARTNNGKNGDRAASELAAAVTPSIAMSTKFDKYGTYDQDSKSFVYSAKRIGNVRPPLSASVLSAFSSYVSRDAFGHDFASN